jgi:hypothetical protein
VARTDDFAHPTEQSPNTVEHELALDRVGLHQLPLPIVQTRGLVEDLLRDGDLPDVVQEGRELQLSAMRGMNAHFVGHGIDHVDDRTRVIGGVAILEFDDVGEEHDGAAVSTMQLEGGRVSLLAVSRQDVE